MIKPGSIIIRINCQFAKKIAIEGHPRKNSHVLLKMKRENKQDKLNQNFG